MYTPQQKQAIESEARYLCVDAGAGSGKTRVLVDRIVHLLRTEKARLDEIVAITFTEKAALEMKERLRKAFRRCAPKDDPVAFSFWRDLERRVDTAHITTIHAFCSRLLRENALFLGLDPDFGLLSDAESALMLHDAVESTMIGLLEKDDPAMARLASECTLFELRGLCKRLLLNRSVVERIRRRGGLDTPEAVRATWHALVEEEQARYIAALGRNAMVNNFLMALRRFDGCCDDGSEHRETWRCQMIAALEEIQTGLSLEETIAALRRVSEKPSGRGAKKYYASPDDFDALAKLQKKVKDFVDALLEPADAADEALLARSAQLTCDLLHLDREINAAYDAGKTGASRLDFDDLVLLALRVLRENDKLRNRTAGRVKYLLLDEFQDTDGQQLEIARLLHDEEGGPDLFIVGDPKQSIYYFRGAEVEIFQKERDAAAELVGLDQNFRSMPGVLEFVNDYFAQSNALCAVERYRPMAVHRQCDAATRVHFMLSDRPEDCEKKDWSVEDYRMAEAGQIAAQIHRLCAADSEATVLDEHTGAFRKPAYGDIALLFRATSNVGLYEEALRKAGIPYTVVAGAGFYERQEVVDVINLLKILADPWDEPALLAYLRGPIVVLSDNDIARMCGLCGRGTLTEVALGENQPEGLEHPERLARARDIYQRLRARLAEPLPELVDHLLEITGLEAILLSQFLGLQKVSNVRKLAALAREQGGRGNLSFRQFVNYLDEVHTYAIREGEAGLQPDGAGAVTLMTIHKSKGLEFPVVFLPDLAQASQGAKDHTLQIHRDLGITLRLAEEDGNRSDTALGSCIKRRIKEEEAAESARVLYVALTRARDLLYLCGNADATLGTWFKSFDLTYGASEREHGDIIVNGKWQARIIRTAPENGRAKTNGTARMTIEQEDIRRRIAPIELDEHSPATISVSQLLKRMQVWETDGHGEDRSDDGQPRVERDRSYAMDRGTLVHRMFEAWDFANAAGPDVGRLVRDARMGLESRARLEDDLRRIQSWFARSPLGARLAGEKGLQREAPFSLRIGETLVNGTIDLLLADGTIVDYKTGKRKEQSSTRYEKQLLLYAAALRALTGIAPRTGVLVYVDAGECVEVALPEKIIDKVLGEAEKALKSAIIVAKVDKS